VLFPSYVSKIADEILYNARIHPEQRCNTLSSEQLTTLHYQTRSVCEVAVAANADESKFPGHWLFKHRWVTYGDTCPRKQDVDQDFQGKGRKEKRTLKLVRMSQSNLSHLLTYIVSHQVNLLLSSGSQLEEELQHMFLHSNNYLLPMSITEHGAARNSHSQTR